MRGSKWWRQWRAAVILFPAVGLAGCDPCAGIAQCIGSPRLAVQGTIVQTQTGKGVAGVLVDIIRSGSSGGAADSVRATTDGTGAYYAVLPAPEQKGTVTVDIAVRPPGTEGYRVEGLEFRTDDRLGEAQVISPWVDRPFYAIAGEALALHDGRTPLIGDSLEFHRTGGAELGGPGWTGGPVRMQADAFGRFPLLGREITTERLENVFGRIALLRDGKRAFTGIITLSPTHLYHPEPQVRIVQLGANFPYLGETRMNDTSVAGVQVTFQRVAGAQGRPGPFTVTSGAGGLFSLAPFSPFQIGDVTFDLTFTPPPPLVPFTKRVTLPVYGTQSFGERFGIFHVDRPGDPPTLFP